ncbi:hypothetical protein COCC4DRAFT_35185, partial [Bipolaris maydis ATCC 48331]
MKVIILSDGFRSLSLGYVHLHRCSSQFSTLQKTLREFDPPTMGVTTYKAPHALIGTQL